MNSSMFSHCNNSSRDAKAFAPCTCSASESDFVINSDIALAMSFLLYLILYALCGISFIILLSVIISLIILIIRNVSKIKKQSATA